MRNFLAALFMALMAPAFAGTAHAECASGYVPIAVPLCQLNSASAPVINSPLTATGTVGAPFSYQITATNAPTSFNVTSLPSGLSVNTGTGLISGTPTAAATTNVGLSATNASGTGTATLVLTIGTAPTFNVGYTTTPTGGSGNSYTSGYNFANGPYTMPQTGTIQSCSIWIQSEVSGTSMQCGVYSAVSSSQPGTLLAASASFTPTAGWNTVPTTTSPSVSSGTSIFMGAIGSPHSNPTLADANSGFNLYGDNGGETTLQSTFLNPAHLDASTFQLGAYATFNAGVTNAPVINSPLTASGTVSTAFSYQITATNSPTSFNATGLPGGLSVNTGTGVISGTPTTAATTNITISAANAAGTGTATLVLTVGSSGAITAVNLTSGFNDSGASSYTTASISPSPNKLDIVSVGSKYTAGTDNIPTVTGAGGTWTQISTQLDSAPAGTGQRRLTLFRDLSATPGSGPLTISFGGQVQDVGILWSVDEFSNVNTTGTHGSGAVVQSVSGAASGTTTGFSVTLATLGASNNAAFGVVRNSSAGAISAGSGFTQLSNVTGSTQGTRLESEWAVNQTSVPWTWASQSNVAIGAAVEINQQNNAVGSPVINSPLTASCTVNTACNYQITATNSPTSFNATGLPSGLSINTSTGAISGTPTATGTSSVALSATNAGGTGTATLALTISQVSAPVITSSTTTTGTVGSAFSYQITATNSPTSYNATGLPGGLSVNTSTGLISGTPTTAATTNVTLSATNPDGTGTAMLTLTINAASGVSKYEYVLNDGSITVYDIGALPTVTVVKTLTVPTSTGTRGAVACGDTLYISYGQDGTGLGGPAHLMAWDLVNDVVKWNVGYSFGIDSHSITRDCTKIYMPTGELASGGTWEEIDATNGNVLGSISTSGQGPHNTFIPSAGNHVYMGPRNTGGLIEGNIPANSVVRTFAGTTNGTVRPFTLDDAETYSFEADSGIAGFQVFSVTTGARLFGVGNTTCSGGAGASACAHGIGLSPDGSTIASIDTSSVEGVHFYNVTGLPGTAPSLIRTISLSHAVTGSETPCAYDCPKDGWLHYSLDGRYVFVGDSGDVISTSSNTVVAYLPAMNNTRKEIEIDFQNGHVCASMTNRQSSNNPETCGVSAAPAITSPNSASCTINTSCSYQITATNSPTSWGATPLPAGMSVNTGTGLISGTPTATGTTNVGLSATNAGGTGTASLALTVNPNAAPGFYVSTTGSDSNAGTITAPFATLSKCQSAMQGSGTKTCYIRAGSYTPAAGPACGSGNCAITLGSSDNGETWSYYPPDGVDTADITGGSTASGNGLWAIFDVGSASGVTFNGLSLHNFDFAAIRTTGGAPNLTVTNNLIFNGFYIIASGAQNAAGVMCYSCANATISHNVVHDIASIGVSISGGGTSNLVYDSNVVYNTCTQIRDCGALYTQDLPQTSTGQKMTNNYVRDGCLFSGCAPGSGGWGAGIYLDDCADNWTITGNVLTGNNGNNTIMYHGGHNISVTDNIVDLSTLGNSINRFQSSSCATVTGNTFENNIVISDGAGGGYNGSSGNMTISNNAYWNYGSGTLSSSGDSNPTVENPLFSCWSYNITSGSPVFSSPVNFIDLTRGWGPPGFTIPQTGSVPSSPHTC